MFLFLPLTAILLAFQPQLGNGALIDTFTELKTKLFGAEIVEQQAKEDKHQGEPTFPPAEQFCTNHHCLSHDIATQISPTSSVHLSKFTTDLPHPAVVKFKGKKSESCAAKFRSLSKRNMAIYWDDGKDGIYQGLLKPGQTTQSNSYFGHRFFFTQENDKSNVIGRVTIDRDIILNVIRDNEFPLSSTHPVMAQTLKEEAYDRAYMAENDGLRWRHFFGENGPRPPPTLNMWPADTIGAIHEVNSSNGYWQCDGNSMDCQDTTPVTAKLQVVSTRPKVFIIDDFLSHHEADHIKALASPKVKESTVGNNEGGGVLTSSTRTSKNTWIPRSSSKVTDTISRRVADVLGLDEAILWTTKNVEDMQVVHYKDLQRYDPHTDWGVQGNEESRFITLLMYLNDPEDSTSGGETSFPKGNCDDFKKEIGCGFKVTPKKGMAAIFYNLLEDGNGDDLSLHAALPVSSGEKWLANFWIWDPKRKN